MNESDILALIRGSATIPYRIYIEGNDTPLTEYDIVSTTYEDYRYVDSDSLVVGQFVARTLNGEIKNINRDLLIEDKEIEVQMGVRVGNSTTWYSLGNFLITKPTEDDVKDKMSFKSMDYTKKFNKTFDPSLITFPCTAVELAQGVCSQCGVELATLDFTNNDFIVENSQYETTDSCRKVMQDIGKLAYSWVRIGWDNKCYIDFDVPTEVKNYNIITNDNYYDFSKQQKPFGVVNRVVVGMKDVEGENVAIQDDDSIAENGLCELHIYDNNLTYTPELRQQVIEGARKLFGLKYIPVEVNTTGHPWLLGNELIQIIDMDGNTIETYPFDRTIEYMGHIKSKLVAKASTTTETQYVNKNTLTELLTKTKIIVDKQNQTITSVVERTEVVESGVSNNYDEIRQLQSTVTQNKSEVEVSISELSKTVQDNQSDLQTSIDNINNSLADGVENLKNTLVTININGIQVSTNLSAISTIMTNDTFAIQTKNGTYLAYFGYDEEQGKTVAEMDNLTVTNYFTAGYHRQEKMENGRTGWFYIG